ncbi:uncharacterized protein THITE_47417 [Thermothielavioides terrestris NRRL 8126]|uniref:C2H2-type domain-containing protein n=1 Tax=Thermothielavioides terrestris (strain ATCC 38088 / NRRL 8126) TaxID=578455 RepID=G2QUH9_THETT|nr:uncharacterized protein THITE_47417 [Thermothielavioides terrestris NRRL 8126]AEO64534.1 hypothetical protein THITE_47417 [Thermothielavioides terrestris NRRL 8126]
MASLSFIMDVTDDHQTDGRSAPHSVKRDKRATRTAGAAGRLLEAPSNPRSSSRLGLATAEKAINQAAPPRQTTRRSASSRVSRSTADISGAEPGTGTEDTITVSSSSSSSSTARPPAKRRQSTASNDSMDHTRYDPAGPSSSSSSMRAGLQRPMLTHPAAATFAARITPKTGRISKAKKGLPVHVCDICRPPKTFTRAEHLRRHQLGHGTPQFQCPGCDKAFHRPDLLARHQQKHEHDGDDLSKSGSPRRSPRRSPAALPFQTEHSPRTPGPRPTASPLATTDMPPTNSAVAVSQPGFSQLPNSAAEAPPQAFTGSYTLSPTLSVVNPARPASLSGPYSGDLRDYQPRTGPHPISVDTHGLQLPSAQPTELPELHDASTWPSSASDSTYSTPASDAPRSSRPWTQGRRSPTADWTASQRPPPYPGSGSRALQSPGPGAEGVPAFQSSLFIKSSYTDAPPSEHSFPGLLNVPSSIGCSSPGTPGQHHPLLSASSNGTVRPHPRQHPDQRSNSVSTSRGRADETLVVSAPPLPDRLDPMVHLDRRKGAMMEAHQDLMDPQAAICGLDLLGGIAVGYGAGSGITASPGADHGGHGADVVAELDLAMGGGCAMPTPISITVPLPGHIRAAIPRYLEVYWASIDPVLPLVHRQSFEAAPDDVLSCAMAAVATQYFSSREDRNRGNDLHEFAWQELKRVPQWSLQTMQAILLCEYFARFRGHKAVTRPSKQFESLFSRVSASLSFPVPPSSAAAEGSGLWLVDPATRSSASSPPSSHSSPGDLVTPTTNNMSLFALRHLSPLQSTPWGNFPSSGLRSSASSPSGKPSPSSASSSRLILDIPRSLGSNVNPNLPPLFASTPTPASAFSNSHSRAQPSWSSLFAPDPLSPAFAPAPAPSLAAPLSQAPRQAYSQRVSTPQVMHRNPDGWDHVLLAANQQHLSIQERWQNWIDVESRRRLFAACLFADGHAAVYHQQRRAHESEVEAFASFEPIPVFSSARMLWEATSAEEWAAILAANPGELQPRHVPPVDQLTANELMTYPPIDRMLILGVLAARLPRRQRTAPAAMWVSMTAGSTTTTTTTNPNGGSGGGNNSDLANLSVVRAVTYAARAIVSFLDCQAQLEQHGTATVFGEPAASWATDISDYWAMYVCALICWAFGHHGRPDAAQQPHQHQHQHQHQQVGRLRSDSGTATATGSSAAGTPGSGASSPAATSSPPSRPSSAVPGAGVAASEEEAVAWLRMIAADGARPEDVLRARGRREAIGVVSLVRRRLENDCPGTRCRLYVDAVGVLRKVEEGVGWKWF